MAELGDTKPATLRIDTHAEESGAAVITLAGDLDMSNADRLKETVAAVTAERPPLVIFSLASLRFIDSAGIAVMLRAATDVGEVRLREPTAPIRRVVELTGLGHVLQIEP
jgi:anti-sigma B factor antagonist